MCLYNESTKNSVAMEVGQLFCIETLFKLIDLCFLPFKRHAIASLPFIILNHEVIGCKNVIEWNVCCPTPHLQAWSEEVGEKIGWGKAKGFS